MESQPRKSRPGITAALSYADAPWFDALLRRLIRQSAIERILIAYKDGDAYPYDKCEWIPAGSLVAGDTLASVIEKTQTKYLLILPFCADLELGPRALRRLLEAAEICQAGLVYADYLEGDAPRPDAPPGGEAPPARKRGKKDEAPALREHPVNDYQLGSLRDDFDFGPLMLFSMDAIRTALKRSGALSAFTHAGLYDLRLRIATDATLFHLREALATVIRSEPAAAGAPAVDEPDARSGGGETDGGEAAAPFAYCDPRQQDRQREMESAATTHLKRLGAWLRPRFRSVVPTSQAFPVEASVVIPVRNRKKTIADAVRSALSQEADFPFNVLCIDNHSTDGTTAVLEKLAKADPRVIPLVPARLDLGIGGCWNEALRAEACGRFAVQLDSDDVYSGPDTLRKIVQCFREGDVAMVIGAYTIVDERGNILPPGLIAHREWTDDNGRNNALRINGLGAPRAFQTALARQIGFLNVSYGEDYAIALRLTRDYRIGRIYENLYLCRRWSGNSDSALTVAQINRHDAFKDTLRTLEIMARRQMNPRPAVPVPGREGGRGYPGYGSPACRSGAPS